MKKLHFESDYMAGAHPQVMELLVSTEQTSTVRFVTSWATTQDDIQCLKETLAALS